tara:strand:+ start:5269 stop:5688 length:420 start_codon:yes stop_codon:yes gene_type:complete
MSYFPKSNFFISGEGKLDVKPKKGWTAQEQKFYELLLVDIGLHGKYKLVQSVEEVKSITDKSMHLIFVDTDGDQVAIMEIISQGLCKLISKGGKMVVRACGGDTHNEAHAKFKLRDRNGFHHEFHHDILFSEIESDSDG